LIHQGKQIELNNCYVQTVGEAKNLRIPENEFAYYQMELPELGAIAVRLGNFHSAEATTFKMDLCQKEATKQTQVMSFDLIVAGRNLAGTIVNKFLETGQTELDQSSFGFNISNYSETETGVDFNSATFQSKFNGRFGVGNSTLTADQAVGSNKVTGSFKNGVGENDFTTHLVCQFDGTTGAAKYSADGIISSFLGKDLSLSENSLLQLGYSSTTPLCPNPNFDETLAMSVANKPCTEAAGNTCTFSASGIDPFKLGGSEALEEATMILSSATNHFNTVNTTPLPSDAVATPVINFTRSWNCSAPTGFTIVDTKGINLSTCTAILKDLSSTSFESSCDQQQNQAEISESQSLPPPPSPDETPLPECSDTIACPEGEICAEGICILFVPPVLCGNSTLDEGEGCDDGNTVDGDGCQADCTIPQCLGDVSRSVFGGSGAAACRQFLDQPSCETAYQFGGSGIVSCWWNGDTGTCLGCGSNNENAGLCVNTCRVPLCGDSIVSPGEGCDDGNNVDGDGCQANCQSPLCGDNVIDIDLGEECDDGNNVDADGCQANCRNPFCGDNIIDIGEQCDDGNNDDGDGCEANCTFPQCSGDPSRTNFAGGPGNSACQQFEDDQLACEQAYHQGGDNVSSCYFDDNDQWCYGCGPNNEGEGPNFTNPGSCSNTCRVSVCGDGFLGLGETCDDGNTDPEDGCESDCTLPPAAGCGVDEDCPNFPSEVCVDGSCQAT